MRIILHNRVNTPTPTTQIAETYADDLEKVANLIEKIVSKSGGPLRARRFLSIYSLLGPLRM